MVNFFVSFRKKIDVIYVRQVNMSVFQNSRLYG